MMRLARSLLDRVKALEQTARSNSLPQQFAISDTSDAKQPVTPTVMQDEKQLLQAGFEYLTFPGGSCWRRVTTFDVITHHGRHTFAELLETDLQRLAHFSGMPVDIESCLFYDTETNGLGTGTGTFPFLHTVGYFEGDEFCVAQYFIDDYDAEYAVLLAIEQAHFGRDVVLVTFNGKSFDWPLLQNRRVLNGLNRLEVAHLDLLHPSRRLWKHHLDSVKLAVIEQAILAVGRVDDVAGSEAPMRYFEFLSTRDVSLMLPVFHHNLLDVCSLVSLQIEVANLLNRTEPSVSAKTSVAIAVWYDAWHDDQGAMESFEDAIQLPDADWRAYWLYSLFLKRRRAYRSAVEMWTRLVEDYPNQVEPLIELAKYYEHRAKAYSEALQMVDVALERLQNSVRGNSETQGQTGPITTSRMIIPHRIEAHKQAFLPVETEKSPLRDALLHRRQRILRKLE